MKYNPKIVIAYFRECGIPEPLVEYQFKSDRKWRFDFAWNFGPAVGIALEVEGGIWTGGAHGRGSGIKRDMEKYNEAAAVGWRVLRVTPDELCTQDTINLLKRTIKNTLDQ